MRLDRITAWMFTMLLFSVACSGQVSPTSDSLTMADADWQVDTLDGFYLKRCHFNGQPLFGAAQHLFVLEIPAESERRMAFVCDTTLTAVSVFAERSNAYAAINGSFFDMDKGNPICYLRIDGTRWGENTPAKTDSVNRKYYQYATIALNCGRPSMIVPDSSRIWEDSMPDSNIMTAGPMLLRGGHYVPQREDLKFVSGRHNRTALGTKADGTTVVLVADGRFKRLAEGLSLMDLQRLMHWLGCTDAINLDGGGSSTMYIRDAEGVVNYPSDNRKHDHQGERPVSNAIVVL